jgi:hypothetical protein
VSKPQVCARFIIERLFNIFRWVLWLIFFQKIIDRSSQIIYWLVTLTVRSYESFRGISINNGGCSTIFLDDG